MNGFDLRLVPDGVMGYNESRTKRRDKIFKYFYIEAVGLVLTCQFSIGCQVAEDY
jgi:hypothetical protein